MNQKDRDRFQDALAAAAPRRGARRSVFPEIMLGMTALVLGAMAVAIQNPREADAVLMQVAGALAPGLAPLAESPLEPDMTTTASITPRPPSGLAQQQLSETLAQARGERDGTPVAVDIDMGELTLRGSL